MMHVTTERQQGRPVHSDWRVNTHQTHAMKCTASRLKKAAKPGLLVLGVTGRAGVNGRVNGVKALAAANKRGDIATASVDAILGEDMAPNATDRVEDEPSSDRWVSVKLPLETDETNRTQSQPWLANGPVCNTKCGWYRITDSTEARKGIATASSTRMPHSVRMREARFHATLCGASFTVSKSK
jgi:hypothetical protein